MKYIIREMCEEDCKMLAEIDNEVFSVSLSEDGFRRELKNKISTTFCAACGEKILGYCNLWDICGEVTINNLAVLKNYRRQGVGEALLNAAVKRFEGEEFLTLEVRVSNFAAIKLYEKFDFKIVGIRKNFYSLPTEDAYIMTRKSKDEDKNE